MTIKEVSERLIRAVAAYYALDIANVTAEDIAKFCCEKYGYDIVYFPLQKLKRVISGVTIIDGDNVIICINSKMSRARQLFTIMHELAHIFLHSKNNGNMQTFANTGHKTDYTDAAWRKEQEADKFASYCMISDYAIVEHAKYAPSFLQLQKTFTISTPALETRLIERLEMIPKVYDKKRAQRVVRDYKFKNKKRFLEVFQKNFD